MDKQCPSCLVWLDESSLKCDNCGEVFKKPTEKKHQKSDKNSQKKCPFCEEIIQVEAIKCKHCGEFLNKNEKKPTSPSKTLIQNTKGTKKNNIVINLFLFLIVWGFILGWCVHKCNEFTEHSKINNPEIVHAVGYFKNDIIRAVTYFVERPTKENIKKEIKKYRSVYGGPRTKRTIKLYFYDNKNLTPVLGEKFYFSKKSVPALVAIYTYDPYEDAGNIEYFKDI